MIELKPLQFDEAIKFFREKGLVVSPLSWRDVWAEEHVRAFTVARVAAMDVLEDIRAEVDRAIEAGVTLKDFKASLGEVLARKGWLTPPAELPEEILPDGTVRKRLTPWRLETIFRTNVQSAYSTGRYRQMLENAPRRPWWMYDAVGDYRTRPSHAAMDGRVYRYDHPIWDKWYPPNGFNCRCTVRTLSDRDMDRRGLKQSVRPPAVEPDEGFAYNPGRAKWQPDLNKYMPKASKILRDDLQLGGSPLPIRSRADIQAVLSDKIGPLLPNGIREINYVHADYFMSTDGQGTFWISDLTRDLSNFRGPKDFTPSRLLEDGLKALGRRQLSFDEEYSLECFWHECVHNLQVAPRDIGSFYSSNYPSSRVIMETLTQWTARRTYHQMLDALGGFRPSHQAEIVQRGYGYQTWVRNLDNLIREMGIDSEIFKKISAEVLETVPKDEYADAVTDRLLRGGALTQENELLFRFGLEGLHYDPDTFSKTISAFE